MIALVESLAAGPAAAKAATASTTLSPKESANPLSSIRAGAEAVLQQPEYTREMIQYFFDEVDNLLPQMHAALQKGNLIEVGRLGHRMKGTVIYLGAQPAADAACAVESFHKAGGEIAAAEKAVKTLDCEITTLTKALASYHQSNDQPAAIPEA